MKLETIWQRLYMLNIYVVGFIRLRTGYEISYEAHFEVFLDFGNRI